MIKNALYQLLTQDTGVRSRLGAPDQVHFNFVPRGAKQPFVVVHCIAAIPIVTLDSTADLLPARLQFDCYAGDALVASGLADAVYDLLRDFNGSVGSPPDVFIQACVVENMFDMPYELGAKDVTYRSLVDVTIWYSNL
jgi:hypothetical protein